MPAQATFQRPPSEAAADQRGRIAQSLRAAFPVSESGSFDDLLQAVNEADLEAEKARTLTS